MKKKMGLILGIMVLCLMTGCGNNNTAETARRVNNQSKTVNDVLQEEMAKEDARNDKDDTSAASNDTTVEVKNTGDPDIKADAPAASDSEKDADTDNTSETSEQVSSTDESSQSEGVTDQGSNGEAEAVRDNTPIAAADIKAGDTVDVDLTKLSSTMVYSEVLNMMTYPDNYVGKTVRMSGLFASYHDDASGNDYYACVIQDATACCAQGIEFILNEDYSYPEGYKEICVAGTYDTYWEGEFRYCTLRNATLEYEKDAAIE
ncbi:MAG: MSCRAMM family adhesin SdrC [Lachnospiraceae bacterium]|nr:MSCRAMM family adhesin SdrC [Lachnospiraceae bacterium]